MYVHISLYLLKKDFRKILVSMKSPFKASLKMVPHKNVKIGYPIEEKMFMECLLMRFFMLAWGSLRAKIANAR